MWQKVQQHKSIFTWKKKDPVGIELHGPEEGLCFAGLARQKPAMVPLPSPCSDAS